MKSEYITENIVVKFKDFDRKMRNIWYEYVYLDKIITESKPVNFSCLSVADDDDAIINSNKCGGLKLTFIEDNNGKSHYIDAILLFEQFVYYLSKTNFSIFPKKLGKEPLSGQKLINMIYSENTIENVLQLVIEEKNRKIFYGNPSDIFEKDPCKFGHSTYFKHNYPNELIYFKKIIAIRNIIIHNNSRIDSKFIKEVRNSTYRRKEKIKITPEILKETIFFLIGLISELTCKFLENNFHSTIYSHSTLKKRKEKFKSYSSKDQWINL